MSVKQMTKVWEWSKADGACLLVMLALADHADDDGFCYPGVERIARKCRISGRSVQRHLKEMSEKGELRIESGRGVTVQGGATNRYRIIVSNGEQTQATQRGDRLTPGVNSDEAVTPGAESGDRAMSPKPSGETSDRITPLPPRGGGPSSSIKSKKPTTPFAIRISKIFNRPLNRNWSDKEIKAFKKLEFHEEDFAIVETYYKSERKRPDNYCRRDIQTFLNNYEPEIDRAREWAQRNPKRAAAANPKPRVQAPAPPPQPEDTEEDRQRRKNEMTKLRQQLRPQSAEPDETIE